MSTNNQPTRTRRDAHVDEISAVDLPPQVAAFADEYDRLLGKRDRFLWRWIYSLFPSFRLSAVADEHVERTRTSKTLLTMYVTVLDDVVEDRGDRRTFEAARARRRLDGLDPREGVAAVAPAAGVDEETLSFLDRLWGAFVDGLSEAPRREAFADVFEYDFEQTMNAIAYSGVVDANPEVATLAGARRYGAHNMVMFPYADVDLMFAPAFETAEFGAVRDLLWDLQEMARIGNWLTTWEREVGEGDFTAGVVVYALEEDIVTHDELRTADREDLVARIERHDVERRFRDRWERRYRRLSERAFDAETVDLDALVEGMATVFEYHMASRGLK